MIETWMHLPDRTMLKFSRTDLNDLNVKCWYEKPLSVHVLSQHFKVLVEELHVKGEAKIKNAMKESFKILNEVSVCTAGGLRRQRSH